MCDYLYDLYLRIQYLYLLLWFSLFKRDGYVCGMCILKYLTGLSTDTYVRIMCVSWLCVVFDLLIYLLGGLIYSLCVVLWLVPTLLPLFFFGVFFFLYIFHIILFLLLLVIFWVVCLLYIFAFLLLLNCWTLVMNFALVIKRFIVSFFFLERETFFFYFCLLQIFRYAPLITSAVRFRGVHNIWNNICLKDFSFCKDIIYLSLRIYIHLYIICFFKYFMFVF